MDLPVESTREIPESGLSMLDLNILPKRHRRRGVPLGSILRGALLLALLILMVPANERGITVQAALSLQQEQLDAAQAALDSYIPLIDEIDLLESDLEAARARIEQIVASYVNVQLDAPTWSALLREIRTAVPADSAIVNIAQAEDVITVSGLSEAYQSPLQMAEDLEQTGLFTLVSVDAISSLTLDETIEAAPAEESEPGEEAEADEAEALEFNFAFAISMRAAEVSE